MNKCRTYLYLGDEVYVRLHQNDSNSYHEERRYLRDHGVDTRLLRCDNPDCINYDHWYYNKREYQTMMNKNNINTTPTESVLYVFIKELINNIFGGQG